MMRRPEPFSTHRLWSAELHQAYKDQPQRRGYHYQLDESCSPAEIEAWREWCRKYPKSLWPNHVLSYAARQAAKGEARG